MNLYKEKIVQGEALFAGGKLHEALQVFESVLKRDPSNLPALNDKGVVLNRMGRFEDAIAAFTEIVERDPLQPNAVFNLVSNCLSLSRWEEAEGFWTFFMDGLPPEDVDLLAAEILETKLRASADDPRLVHAPLTLNIRSRKHDLRLFLDTRQYTQKIQWEHLSHHRVYEGETLQFLAQVLNPGDGFMDVGGHIGYFSLIASRMVGEGGRVIAVEPHPGNCVHFSKHLAVNGIRNTRLIRAVAGSRRGEAEFFLNADNDGGHALWSPGLHPFNRKSREKPLAVKVSMVTLDDLIADAAGAVKALKIDTEGAEMEVLRGGAGSLQDLRIPYVICEINRFGLDQMGSSEKEVRGFMEGLGYETYFMQEQHPRLIKLEGEQVIDAPYVFNLLFAAEKPFSGELSTA